jgi:multiple sugar transport system substrate-binding protein
MTAFGDGRGVSSRGAFLRRTAGLALGLPALGALAAACGGDDDDAAPAVSSAPAGTSAATTMNRALRLHHDAALGPAFEPFVARFNEQYTPLKLETSYVTQDYIGTTQTQLAGGSVDYDVLFADPGYLEKWYAAGWIQPIDDLPGVEELLAGMPDDLVSLLRASDGKLVALPYYVGTDVFIYNAEHLEAIGAEPPATWDEMVEQCRELKAKGVSDTPYSPWWIKDFSLIYYALLDCAISDGAQPFFDDAFAPQFQDDPVVTSVIERWKTLYAEGLVPQDIFTTDYGSITNILAGGKSTFTHQYQVEMIGLNTPETSTVAGSIKNALMPGATRETLSFAPTWFMTSSTPNREAAWQLMTYLAAKDNKGEFTVPRELIALGQGLGTPYADVNADPAVRESWSAWADVDLLLEQIGKTKTMGPVVNQEWFSAYMENFSGLLQDAIRDAKPVADALNDAAEFARTEAA